MFVVLALFFMISLTTCDWNETFNYHTKIDLFTQVSKSTAHWENVDIGLCTLPGGRFVSCYNSYVDSRSRGFCQLYFENETKIGDAVDIQPGLEIGKIVHSFQCTTVSSENYIVMYSVGKKKDDNKNFLYSQFFNGKGEKIGKAYSINPLVSENSRSTNGIYTLKTLSNGNVFLVFFDAFYSEIHLFNYIKNNNTFGKLLSFSFGRNEKYDNLRICEVENSFFIFWRRFDGYYNYIRGGRFYKNGTIFYRLPFQVIDTYDTESFECEYKHGYPFYEEKDRIFFIVSTKYNNHYISFFAFDYEKKELINEKVVLFQNRSLSLIKVSNLILFDGGIIFTANIQIGNFYPSMQDVIFFYLSYDGELINTKRFGPSSESIVSIKKTDSYDYHFIYLFNTGIEPGNLNEVYFIDSNPKLYLDELKIKKGITLHLKSTPFSFALYQKDSDLMIDTKIKNAYFHYESSPVSLEFFFQSQCNEGKIYLTHNYSDPMPSGKIRIKYHKYPAWKELNFNYSAHKPIVTSNKTMRVNYGGKAILDSKEILVFQNCTEDYYMCDNSNTIIKVIQTKGGCFYHKEKKGIIFELKMSDIENKKIYFKQSYHYTSSFKIIVDDGNMESDQFLFQVDVDFKNVIIVASSIIGSFILLICVCVFIVVALLLKKTLFKKKDYTNERVPLNPKKDSSIQ